MCGKLGPQEDEKMVSRITGHQVTPKLIRTSDYQEYFSPDARRNRYQKNLISQMRTAFFGLSGRKLRCVRGPITE